MIFVYFLNEETITSSKKDLSYSEEADSISELYKNLSDKAGASDQTLVPHVEALSKQALNRLEIAEKKLIRAEKRKHEDALGQITGVKNALFPNGELQERHDNFLNFYQKDPEFIDTLLQEFDAFDFRMHVLTE